MPGMFDFGGPVQEPAQQQIQQSQILARLLSQGIPQSPPSPLAGIQSAIMSRGISDVLQGNRDQRALSNTGVPFTRQPVDIDALKRAQGLNLRRF